MDVHDYEPQYPPRPCCLSIVTQIPQRMQDCTSRLQTIIVANLSLHGPMLCIASSNDLARPKGTQNSSLYPTPTHRRSVPPAHPFFVGILLLTRPHSYTVRCLGGEYREIDDPFHNGGDQWVL